MTAAISIFISFIFLLLRHRLYHRFTQHTFRDLWNISRALMFTTALIQFPWWIIHFWVKILWKAKINERQEVIQLLKTFSRVILPLARFFHILTKNSRMASVRHVLPAFFQVVTWRFEFSILFFFFFFTKQNYLHEILGG